MQPRHLVLVFAVLLLALTATSRPQRVGDGHEYLAMALNLAALHGPALSPRDRARVEADLARFHLSGLPLDTHGELRDGRGRQDFFHFWFYSALAVPGIWAARLLVINPNYAFVALNLILFIVALRVVSSRVEWWLAAAIFCSPALWWIDKSHTEIFTFSLLAIAFALIDEAPWWSMIALAAAATQNPPIALLLVALMPVLLLARPGTWRDKRFWAGAVGSAAIALLHPAYYEWRWAVATPQLIKGTEARVPTIREVGAVLWDPNLGILYQAPLLALVVTAAAVAVAFRGRARLLGADVLLALLAAAIFLPSFAQSTNMNNGATPGMSRYALWLIPLAIPLLRRAGPLVSGSTRTVLAAVALASCLWSVVAFHPSRPESYCAPSWVASLIWARLPALDNPLPEVLTERLSGREPGLAPIATAGCTKVLLLDGHWPVPCRPQPAPPFCLSPGSLCYANLASVGRYRFVQVPPPPAAYSLETRHTWIWGPDATPAIDRILAHIVGWRQLRQVERSAPGAVLRDAQRVSWTYDLESSDEVLLYVRRPREGATVTLQLPGRIDGQFLDADTGAELQPVRIDGSQGELVQIPVPVAPAVALVLRHAR